MINEKIKMRNGEIEVKETENRNFTIQEDDYISLTDMLRATDGDFFISDWLRNRNTVEYLAIQNYADIPQFVYLANLENQNAFLINEGLSQEIRLEQLNLIDNQQMKILTTDSGIKKLE